MGAAVVVWGLVSEFSQSDLFVFLHFPHLLGAIRLFDLKSPFMSFFLFLNSCF